MDLRRAIGTIVAMALGVVAIVVLTRACDAIVGIDRASDRATFVGMPVVLLVLAPLIPLETYLRSPGPSHRSQLRQATVRGVALALALAPVTALCLLAFGTRIDRSDGIFWLCAAIQFATLFALLGLLRRVAPMPRRPSRA